jgi:LuxR family maltose regulon positive regulatory protein
VLGELNFHRGLALFWQGQSERSRKCFVEALVQLPETCRLVRAETDFFVGLAHCLSGQKEEALLALNNKIESQGLSDKLVGSRWLGGRLFIYSLSGELAQAAEAAQKAQSLGAASGNVYVEAWSRYLQASVHLQSYDLEVALPHFRFAAEQRYRLHKRAAMDALAGLALTYQVLQRPRDVTETLTQLLEFAQETDDLQNLVVARSCQARVALLQGDLKSALRREPSLDGEPDLSSLFFWLEVPVLTRARILVAVGSDRSLQQATDLLRTLRQQTETWHLVCPTIEILVLQALVLQKQGRTDEALAVLEEAVALAGPHGWVRPFVELGEPMADLLQRLPEQNGFRVYTDEILAKFVPSVSRPAQATGRLVEALTNREEEILPLLIQRLQDKEIAARLFISTETVKSHLKHLYQKLDVRSRRQAVEKARALGLLSDQRGRLTADAAPAASAVIRS